MDDEIEVDARGHRCPMPTLRLARALRVAPAGTLIRLLTDDPIARVDVPHFASQTGVQILAIEGADEGLTILVRKPDL